MSTIVPYFRIICQVESIGVRVMKRALGYMALRRALSINLLPRAILAFVYKCSLTVVLIQSNFDTPCDTTRSDTN